MMDVMKNWFPVRRELIGVTGRRVTEAWCVRRRWKQSRVVSEYHYAHRLDGEALSFDDLRIAAPRDPDTVKPSRPGRRQTMRESIGTSTSEPIHPLGDRTLTSRVPIAALI